MYPIHENCHLLTIETLFFFSVPLCSCRRSGQQWSYWASSCDRRSSGDSNIHHERSRAWSSTNYTCLIYQNQSFTFSIQQYEIFPKPFLFLIRFTKTKWNVMHGVVGLVLNATDGDNIWEQNSPLCKRHHTALIPYGVKSYPNVSLYGLQCCVWWSADV